MPMRPTCPLLRFPLYFLLSDLAVFHDNIVVMPFAFEKLVVYQKAVASLTLARYRLRRSFVDRDPPW